LLEHTSDSPSGVIDGLYAWVEEEAPTGLAYARVHVVVLVSEQVFSEQANLVEDRAPIETERDSVNVARNNRDAKVGVANAKRRRQDEGD
jgi:hypothetical protein